MGWLSVENMSGNDDMAPLQSLSLLLMSTQKRSQQNQIHNHLRGRLKPDSVQAGWISLATVPKVTHFTSNHTPQSHGHWEVGERVSEEPQVTATVIIFPVGKWCPQMRNRELAI